MRPRRHRSTVRSVTEQGWRFLKREWFTLLVVVGMVEAGLQILVMPDDKGAPTISVWIAAPLAVIMLAPLLW